MKKPIKRPKRPKYRVDRLLENCRTKKCGSCGISWETMQTKAKVTA